MIEFTRKLAPPAVQVARNVSGVKSVKNDTRLK